MARLNGLDRDHSNFNRAASSGSADVAPQQRGRPEGDNDWVVLPISVQISREMESSYALGEILQKAGGWLQWGFQGAWKGMEKTRDGVKALMDYRRMKQQHKEALELASRQHWALLELEAQRRRELEQARLDEEARQAELAKELQLVEKVKREKAEAERRWRDRFDALVSASEAHESLAMAKQAELELLRREVERREEVERDALRALDDLRARQQAQQKAEREAAERLKELEETYRTEVDALRQRLVQLQAEGAAAAAAAASASAAQRPPSGEGGAADLPDEFYCSITMEVMTDPVLAADGFSYERSAIQDWLDKGNRTSPKTGALLHNDQLLPNLSLRSLIQDRLHCRR